VLADSIADGHLDQKVEEAYDKPEDQEDGNVGDHEGIAHGINPFFCWGRL